MEVSSVQFAVQQLLLLLLLLLLCMMVGHDVEAAVVVVVAGRGRLRGGGHSVVAILVSGVRTLLRLQVKTAPWGRWRRSLHRISESGSVVFAGFRTGEC